VFANRRDRGKKGLFGNPQNISDVRRDMQV
jgi:hypothetical protein